LSRADGVVDL